MKFKHIFFISLISLFILNGSTNSGPYRATILSVTGSCEATTKPRQTVPSVEVNLELYNTSTKSNLMRGNITMMRSETCKRVIVKYYAWTDNAWKIKFVLKTAACNGVTLPLAAIFMGIKYNRKSCLVYKGTYAFSSVDGDSTQHMFMNEQEYGRQTMTVEVHNHNSTIVCVNTTYVVEPLE